MYQNPLPVGRIDRHHRTFDYVGDSRPCLKVNLFVFLSAFLSFSLSPSLSKRAHTIRHTFRFARRYSEVWGAFDVPTVSELEGVIFGQFLKDAVKGDRGLFAKTQ